MEDSSCADVQFKIFDRSETWPHLIPNVVVVLFSKVGVTYGSEEESVEATRACRVAGGLCDLCVAAVLALLHGKSEGEFCRASE